MKLSIIENIPVDKNILNFVYVFLISIIVINVLNWILTKWVTRIIKKTRIKWDDVIIDFLTSFGFVFRTSLALFVSFTYYSIDSIFANIATSLIFIIIAFNLVRGIKKLFAYFMKANIGDSLHLDSTSQLLVINTFGVLLWIIAIIILLQNFGVNISALLGGLGIFGIAVAFSLQNILEDIFAYFTILSDRPFQTGDFIVVGSEMGAIEKIGLKSTRLSTPSGEELIINNKKLIDSYIHNYKRMSERRILFNLGVSYNTTPEQLSWIKKYIEEVVNRAKNARFDRVHFSEFGDSALLLEISFYITTNDYAIKMDVQEEINMSILKGFNNKGIEIAYPTQTLHIKK